MQHALPIVAIAIAAAALQAVATIGAFAWLSRSLPTDQIGRFGLYLAITSLVAGLDGLRQPIVVAAATSGRNSLYTAHLATISFVTGIVVATCVAVFGHLALSLGWWELSPLVLTSLLMFVCSPGLAVLEATRGPQYSTALQSTAWAAAIAVGAAAALSQRDIAWAAWGTLLAPAAVGTVLAATRSFIRPSLRSDSDARRNALHGLRSHVVTALSGFVDKGAIVLAGGIVQLGMYTPIAELTSRAGALAGGVANLFLRDEARLAASIAGEIEGVRPHRQFLIAFIVLACVCTFGAAIFAGPLLNLFLGRTDPTQILTFQLLLACLAINVGAHWSAVAIKARAQFDLYRPYAVALIVALAAAPSLITMHGVVGGALVAMILRSADVAVLARGRHLVSRTHIAVVATATILILLTAIFPFAQSSLADAFRLLNYR